MPSAIITLRSGLRVDLFRPRPEDVRINDIAHALSHICRWGGHCREFYSVAEHSLILSYHVSHPLWGLLHDATEAYVGDMARPFKAMMPAFSEVEALWEAAVREAFGLPPMPPDVKTQDLRLAVTEGGWLYGEEMERYMQATWRVRPLGTRRFLWAPGPAKPTWVGDPPSVRHAFLLRYEELTLRPGGLNP